MLLQAHTHQFKAKRSESKIYFKRKLDTMINVDTIFFPAPINVQKIVI